MISINIPLVSIIVPVYNAENYISRTIESILNQTYKNFELILINDGSLDNSEQICTEFTKKDERVKVITQENAGPSEARNKGIRNANGLYIQFVDSDDYIEENMLEVLVDNLDDETDLVISGYKQILNNQGKETIEERIPPISGKLSHDEFFENIGILHSNGFTNTLWNKLYKADIIVRFQLRFNKQHKIGEDLLFNLDYFKRMNGAVSLLEFTPYNYLVFNNEQSLTKIYKENYFENRKIVIENLTDLLQMKGAYNNKNKEILMRYNNLYLYRSIENLFHENSQMNFATRKQELSTIINDRWLERNIDSFRKVTLQDKLVISAITKKRSLLVYILFRIKKIVKK